MPEDEPLPLAPTAAEREARDEGQGALLHRLNNQLGIILANAELLESRLAQQAQNRARAAQIVTSAIDAISTVQDIAARGAR